MCSCKDGYTDDGLGTCVDINECLNADACGGNGTRICVNLVPDYSCSCRYGYEGDTCETQSTNGEQTECMSHSCHMYDSIQDEASLLTYNLLTT